jgi:hypothetical protein
VHTPPPPPPCCYLTPQRETRSYGPHGTQYASTRPVGTSSPPTRATVAPAPATSPPTPRQRCQSCAVGVETLHGLTQPPPSTPQREPKRVGVGYLVVQREDKHQQWWGGRQETVQAPHAHHEPLRPAVLCRVACGTVSGVASLKQLVAPHGECGHASPVNPSRRGLRSLCCHSSAARSPTLARLITQGHCV